MLVFADSSSTVSEGFDLRLAVMFFTGIGPFARSIENIPFSLVAPARFYVRTDKSARCLLRAIRPTWGVIRKPRKRVLGLYS
jgi:hypothetical protein